MTEPIPTAGETTIIGMPAIHIPMNTTSDRPMQQDD
ncbi:FHA domain-containing protein, partial [Bifidobacteriaceae bacterium WP022]